MDNLEYLSDEELLSLIGLSETDGLLTAPVDLKQNVLTQAERETAIGRERERKRQYRQFCIRVVAGMAAALILAFAVLPVLQNMNQQREAVNTTRQFFEINQTICEKSNGWIQKLSDGTTLLLNGGNNHE